LIQVEIWSDIVCPWCYIGKRRFERGLATLDNPAGFEVVHRAFQLDPSMPRGDVRDHRDNLMAKYGLSESQATAKQQQMERTAAAEGLEFHLVGGVTGHTFDAHRLVHLGRVRGIQDAVIERLFRAHFTEQRSIFDVDSLVTLAGEAGLDTAEARAALAGDAYVEDVNADLRDARGFGISGVPYYVLDRRFAISGAQPPELFAEALRASRPMRAHLAIGDNHQSPFPEGPL
jgi:predicted DsbA family dithiol-disulfide isomerase